MSRRRITRHGGGASDGDGARQTRAEEGREAACSGRDDESDPEITAATSNARQKRARETTARRPDDLPGTSLARESGRRAAAAAAVAGAIAAEPPPPHPQPSVLVRLLEELPEVFERHFLPCLEPVDRTLLAQVGKRWRTAVIASGLGRAGVDALIHHEPLLLSAKSFVDTVERCDWAIRNGMPRQHISTAYYIGLVGSVDVLRLVCGGVVDQPEFAANGFDIFLCHGAARGGHLDMLRVAREEFGFKWNFSTCDGGALSGKLETLQYARAGGCAWTELCCANAAKGGHVDVLKWAHENGAPWTTKTCNFAAHFGQLETLRYAVEHNCPLEPQNCALAARGGHLHCLQYLRSPSVDCPWESDTCEYAAMNGHLHCLRWAHENGCEWDYLTTREARRNGHTECLNFAIAHGCDEISDLSDVSDVSSVEYEEDSYESDTSLTNTDTGDG